jgi:hypothetical protein
MRYLYGDSVPFPQQYNFLSTFDAFVTCATRALSAGSDISRVKGKTAADADARAKSVAALETFHQGVVRYLTDALKKTSEPVILDYSRQLQEVASRGVDGAKKASAEANEREEGSVRGDMDRKRIEIRTALDGFLRVAGFPSLHHAITMKLDGSGHKIVALISLPKGISASFNIAVGQAREWNSPRRVSEFAGGLVLKIGLKKGWMKKTVELEPVPLDDLILSGFEIDEHTAEIRLRRKIEQDDSFVFRARKSEDKNYAEVLRPLDEGPDAHPSPLDTDERNALEKLVSAVRSQTVSLLAHREALLSVSLDARDVLDQDLIAPFIERVVQIIEPVLAEVDRRSPNPEELSMKVQDDRGRREEVYLRKADLLAKMDALPQELRACFEPLGLSPGETLGATDVTVDVT